MIQRILGVFMILIGLSGLVLSVMGTAVAGNIIDALGVTVADGLTLTSQTLDTVEETLLLTKETVTVVSDSLDTVETAGDDLALAISETVPLLDEINVIVSQEVPQSLETIETAVPDMVEVAGIIDDTLVTLSRFRVQETVPIINYEINLSLGIDYNPSVPFDQSVAAIGTSLDGMPERLRGLEGNVNVAGGNLQRISDDLQTFSDDLAVVNQQLEELNPLLDEYVATVITLNDTARQTRAGISEELESAKQAITLVMIWLGLTQIVPLYLGIELLLKRR